MISQKTVQEVLNTAQITEVVEDYVSLKRRGANMLGLCPFHDEKTPSFTVSPSKNIFKCFGCGKGGNPVHFLMEHDHLSFPEAIRTLAKKYNITIEEETRENEEEYQEQRKLEESYFIINQFASEYFTKNLLETNDGRAIALPYFKERGFLESTIKKFELGYSVDQGKGLTERAIKNQFKEEYLKEIGLTSQKGYDFFRNRVMFPIHNVAGKIIAFAGRTLSTNKKQPKYINSPETPIYNKRKILYAIHLAKNEIRKKDNCYIVEGYTDVISLFQNGIENVVASSGTALTSEQVRLVKRYSSNITFLYDGDPAGIKAALRGLDIVLENDMNVKLVLLPEGEDPDSYVQKVGSTAFDQYIEDNAKDFIYFKLDLLLEDAGDDPIKKSKVIKDIIRSLAKVREPIKRSLYLRQCSQSLDLDEKILVNEVNKIIREDIKQKRLEKERLERQELTPAQRNQDYFPEEHPAPAQQQQTYSESRHEFQEKDLARIMVCAGDKVVKTENDEDVRIADFIIENINDVLDHFENEYYKSIILEGFKYAESEESENLSLSDYFINHKEESIKSFAIDCMSSKYIFADWEKKDIFLQTQPKPDENFYRDSLQAILRFKLKKITKVIDALKTKTMDPNLDPTHIGHVLKAYQQLMEQRKMIAEELGTVVPGR